MRRRKNKKMTQRTIVNIKRKDGSPFYDIGVLVKITKDKIITKDVETGERISWDRDVFYAEKPLSFDYSHQIKNLNK